MLAFFRKYQRFFYIIITTVIVISFSFFGTYGAFQDAQPLDKPAFTAVDGSEIFQSELDAMVLFLSTDQEDKLFIGGRWGPNFLNDGVIKKDFLETGLAEVFADSFLNELKSDLKTRHLREKRWVPYQHPEAKFLNAANAWNVVAPEINQKLAGLKEIRDPASPEGFKIRVNLYLAERNFPHPALRMVLQHQQKQYHWISPDPNLNYTDLALFGYHTLEDWFGSRFMRLSAAFVINSAKVAEARGYRVSKGEALADLYRNAELNFQQLASHSNLGVSHAEEYLNEQLRRMGMDQTKAIAVWKQVMLFRRLFHDLGSSVLVDPFTLAQLHDYAKEVVEGDLYQLPPSLRLRDFRGLQLFETYLGAVSDRPSGKERLELPRQLKSAEEVGKSYPELVEKRFLIELSSVDKRGLAAKVGVKEAWEWEVKEAGWAKLKKQFPELGVKKGDSEGERYAALEALDSKTRQRVDAFARVGLVEEHPEWLSQALQEAPAIRKSVGIRKKGGSPDFPGLTDSERLIQLLDRYPASQKELEQYTNDGQLYYRINVIDRSAQFEVLTFEEAGKEGLLNPILDRKLEAHYASIRSRNPEEFQNKEGSWKPLDQVRQQVAEDYFSGLIKEIQSDYATTSEKKEHTLDNDDAASLRLYSFMRRLRERFRADPASMTEWIREEKEDKEPPLQKEPLWAQWKIEKRPYIADRSTPQLPVSSEEAFSLPPGEWTSVMHRPNGDMAFFHLKERKKGEESSAFYEQVMRIHQALSADAQKILMGQLVEEMNAKKALTLKNLRMDESEG